MNSSPSEFFHQQNHGQYILEFFSKFQISKKFSIFVKFHFSFSHFLKLVQFLESFFLKGLSFLKKRLESLWPPPLGKSFEHPQSLIFPPPPHLSKIPRFLGTREYRLLQMVVVSFGRRNLAEECLLKNSIVKNHSRDIPFLKKAVLWHWKGLAKNRNSLPLGTPHSKTY